MLNLMTFVGIALLAVPVIALNERKRLSSKLTAPDPSESADTAMETLRDNAARRASHWTTKWRRTEQNVMYAGYTLLLSSSFLRLFEGTAD